MAFALLVEDDPDSLQLLDSIVRSHDFETLTASSLSDARRHLKTRTPDLAIVDVRLPDGDGIEFVQEVPSTTTTVVISGAGDPEVVVRALRCGVEDFLTKPIDLAHLKLLLARFDASGRGGPGAGVSILGESAVMRATFESVERASRSEETVLILGETGVGKELVADELHRRGSRAGKPFVAVNCGAIPETLIESELFGHARGSFTGAHKKHAGVFERADGGTLFLDEITELPLQLQVRLLRVLEHRVVTPVGGTAEIPVDVRVLAACNRDPLEAVESGHLREDLLYRLHVLPIEIPPLRARGSDLELLARAFLSALNRATGQAKAFSPEALEALRAHDWPGNVRELQNAVRRAHVFSGAEIGSDAIQVLRRSDEPSDPYAVEVGMTLEEAERRVILGTLEREAGNKKSTAKTLGVSLKTIYNRLHKYGVDV